MFFIPKQLTTTINTVYCLPFLILTQDYFCHTLNACSTQTVMITSHFGLELFAGECRLAHNLKTRQLLSAKTLFDCGVHPIIIE